MSFFDNFFGKKRGARKRLTSSVFSESEEAQGKKYAYDPGDRIAGRYEVVGILAGGMAVVYFCADHAWQQRPLALKTFKPKYLSSRKARDRFLREGTIWVGLTHPNVVRAYGVERIGDGREIYLVLEWVAAAAGKDEASLRAWLEPDKPLPVEQALLFALHIARGMKYATDKIPGLVHRDLKPENVLVGRDGNARVSDFGLARTLIGVEYEDKNAGALKGDFRRTVLSQGMVGTPLFMAPEQWVSGARLDTRADIYAFGCILYEMAVGRSAVTGESLAELSYAHRYGNVQAIPSHLPVEVKALIQRCMALEPKDRCQNWEEVERSIKIVYKRVIRKSVPVEVNLQGKTPAALRNELVAAGWSYQAMGLSYYDIGSYDLAAGYFERVVWVGEQQKEPALEASGLSHLGNVCRVLSDVDGAIRCHKRQLKIVRSLGNRPEESDALGNLGNNYAKLGDLTRAIVYYQQQIGIARELKDLARELLAVRNWGDASREMGMPEKAIQFYNHALTLVKKYKDRTQEGRVLGTIGAAYAQMGNVKKAMRYYKQALDIAQEIGDRTGKGIALGYLGIAYRGQGNTEQAILHLMEYLVITRDAGLRFEEGFVLSKLGRIYFEEDDPGQALVFYQECLRIVRKLGDQVWFASVLQQVGDCYRDLGKFDQAIGYYEENLSVAKEINNPLLIAKALYNLGNIYRNVRDTSRARPYYEDALQIAETLEDELLGGNIKLDFSLLFSWEGDRDKAITYSDAALKIFRTKKKKNLVKEAKQVISYIRRH